MNVTKEPANRRGTSTAEVLISITLLGFAVLGVGKFSSLMHASLESRRQAILMAWELESAKQVISSWPVDSVNPERIEALELSQNISGKLSDAGWQADVTEIKDPLPAVRVDLRLVGKYKGQSVQPQNLIFWLPKQEPAS